MFDYVQNPYSYQLQLFTEKRKKGPLSGSYLLISFFKLGYSVPLIVHQLFAMCGSYWVLWFITWLVEAIYSKTK